MSTSDRTPEPPAGRPWRGGATDRPPWEQDADATQQVRPDQLPGAAGSDRASEAAGAPESAPETSGAQSGQQPQSGQDAVQSPAEAQGQGAERTQRIDPSRFQGQRAQEERTRPDQPLPGGHPEAGPAGRGQAGRPGTTHSGTTHSGTNSSGPVQAQPHQGWSPHGRTHPYPEHSDQPPQIQPGQGPPNPNPPSPNPSNWAHPQSQPGPFAAPAAPGPNPAATDPAGPQQPGPQQPGFQPPGPQQPAPQQPAPNQPPKRSELTGQAPRGDSTARRVTRAVARVFGSSKQPRELEEVLAAVQAPITTGRRIAVTSVRGGAGKTAVAALLGSVFATRRTEPVLALDAEPESGSLAWRLGVDTAMTLPGLAPALRTASGQSLGSIERLLPRTSRGLWVAPGSSGAQHQLARDVTRALSRLFAVAVLDCGTGLNAPATSAVLSDAHSVVVVTPATPDGVRTTADALARIGPGPLQHVVVALNAADQQGVATLKRGPAEALFSRLGLPVVVLPYDRHVASGGTIDPGRLAEPTITAGSRLAAWSLRRSRTL